MGEVQEAGPAVGQNLTDAHWRILFGDEPGIHADTDGTAYEMTLPTSSDIAEVGSPNIDSIARVGGFFHRVPAGTTQSIEIPPSIDAAAGRTDIIAVRLDPTWADGVFPVRLYRIPGTEGSAALPVYDQSPPGVEDLPLWGVNRKAGQSLNQASLTDLRMRTGPNLLAAEGLTFPSMVPLGTRATRGGATYRRDLAAGAPTWIKDVYEQTVLTGLAATASAGTGWQRQSDCRLVRLGNLRWLHLVVHRSGSTLTSNSTTGGIQDQLLASLNGIDNPPSGVAVTTSGRVRDAGGNTYAATGHVTAAGNAYLNWMAPGVSIGPSSPDDSIRLDACWFV